MIPRMHFVFKIVNCHLLDKYKFQQIFKTPLYIPVHELWVYLKTCSLNSTSVFANCMVGVCRLYRVEFADFFSLFLMYMFRIHIVLTDLLVTNYLYFTSANSGAGTAYPSGAPEFLPGFSWVRLT